MLASFLLSGSPSRVEVMGPLLLSVPNPLSADVSKDEVEGSRKGCFWGEIFHLLCINFTFLSTFW